MDAARRYKDEAIWADGPESFARREQPAKSGRGNGGKYHRGYATRLDSYQKWEKNMVE